METIIKYASLAPSGHNTQPWKFWYDQDSIKIYPDYSRQLPAVDPDNRELFISLGCALENLVTAAEHYGFNTDIEYDLAPEGKEVITIHLSKSDSIADNPLFVQIPERQSTRNEYNGEKVPSEIIKSILKTSEGYNACASVITESPQIEEVIQLVKKGNTIQFDDTRFMDELKFWIRFSNAEAEEKMDGLSSSVTGNPSVPRWIGKLYMDLFNSVKDQNEMDEKNIMSSAGLILFSTIHNNKREWVETGRIFERFSLYTTSLNIRCAHINQPVEIDSLHKNLKSAFSLENGYPQLLLRFGYADKMPYSKRRGVSEILIKDGE